MKEPASSRFFLYLPTMMGQILKPWAQINTSPLVSFVKDFVTATRNIINPKVIWLLYWNTKTGLSSTNIEKSDFLNADQNAFHYVLISLNLNMKIPKTTLNKVSCVWSIMLDSEDEETNYKLQRKSLAFNIYNFSNFVIP